MSPTLSSPGKAVLPPSQIAHIVLQTTPASYSSMVSFYTTFLGARPAFANSFMTLLRYDAEHHRIGIVCMPDLQHPKDVAKPGSAGVTGMAHMAFTYGSLEDLGMAWLQRKENGILPVWSVNHGPTMSVYYRDPDGNTIECQVDCMDVGEADDFMKGEAYAMNPFGIDFDMADVVEKLKSGIKEGDLTKRVETGPRGIETVPLAA